ncbi:MAG: YcxB family protein [Erysipelotrichaceae bacterium]|nr:YcxB family protein [Erysipelotrichaceae bacterium]
MEIRYVNNNEDMKQQAMLSELNSVEYNEDNARLVRMYHIMAILLALWGLIQIVIYLTNRDNTQSLPRGISFIFMALFMMGFAWAAPKVKKFFLKRRINKEYSDVSRQYPENILTVDSKNIIWQQGKEKISHKLTEELGVQETENCYLIDLKKKQIAVPKRVFSDAQFAEFDRLFKITGRLAKTSGKNSEKKG